MYPSVKQKPNFERVLVQRGGLLLFYPWCFQCYVIIQRCRFIHALRKRGPHYRILLNAFKCDVSNVIDIKIFSTAVIFYAT